MAQSWEIKFHVVPEMPVDTDVAFVGLSPEAKRDVVIEGTDGRRRLVMKEPKSDCSETDRRRFMRRIISVAKANGLKRLAMEGSLNLPVAEFLAGNYEHVRFKKESEDGWNFVTEIFFVASASEQLEAHLERGRILGEGINLARDLANAPANHMTPDLFIRFVARKAENIHTVSALDAAEMERLGMGGILAVGKGSVNEPRLLVMEWMNGPKGEAPVALVGKGVCFDTGGVNQKADPTDMQMDKSGGAAVAAAVITAARLGVAKNIIGLVPLVENRESDRSYLQHDVIRMMDGTTVEVMNTDAEGRLILADALTHAKCYNPRLVVDVATLTGAAMVALGNQGLALFTRHDSTGDELAKSMIAAGGLVGERLWRLPLWDDYDAQIKADNADLRNTGKAGRAGGASTAAAFLKHFAKDFPNWAHIDMAPRMTSAEGDHLAKGATGEPVRLLVRMLEGY